MSLLMVESSTAPTLEQFAPGVQYLISLER